MNSLFKLTVVAVVIQSGLCGIATAQINEVVFFEETSVDAGSVNVEPAGNSELTFTETFVSGDQVQPGDVGSPIAPVETKAVTPVVEFTEEKSQKSEASGDTVVFSEERLPVERPPVVNVVETSVAPAVSEQAVRREVLTASEELTILTAQIKSKSGERNSLAVLRQAQTDAASLEKQQGRLILLTNVEVEGNTVIDEAALAAVSAPFVGRRIMLSDLEELRVRLTRLYTESGYVNSGVVLPDQKVENGNIVYSVIEGSLSDVTIEGEGSLREKYITDRVMAGVVKPFNSFSLQENFQLLLDDPLIERMDGKLRDIPGRGLSALDLKVTRARPYDFSVTTSNHGAPSLGAEQIFAAGVVRNISGFGDALGVTVGGNGSKFSITTEYEVPIRSDDTRVKVRITAADSSVIEEPLDTIDIESNSVGIDLSVTRPLMRTLRKSIITGAGISVRKSNNSLEGVPFSFSPGEEEGRSKASVARVWQEFIHQRDVDVFSARATLNIGLDMFGSTIHDDGRPDSEFVSVQAQLQYARKTFDDKAQVLLRLEGQLANGELLPLERFSLGGADTVRGYRENELVRDQAVLASAELRYPFFRSADLGTFQLAPFVDIGYARNKSFFIADELLASIGLGLLWNYSSHISGELYFGAGLKDDEPRGEEDLQDHGVHLKIVAKF